MLSGPSGPLVLYLCDARWAGPVPPVAGALVLPGAAARAPAAPHEAGRHQACRTPQEVTTARPPLRNLNHLEGRETRPSGHMTTNYTLCHMTTYYTLRGRETIRANGQILCQILNV